MECPKCHQEYDEQLPACPHCQAETVPDNHYVKPSAVCKNCATPMRSGDRFCPSCGFDQKKSIIKQTRSGKATRLIGPMVGLFAFLFLVVASLGVAYYFISRANNDDTIRAESIRVVNRSTNETIARLKENPDLELSESEWDALRNLLDRDDYRERMADSLEKLQTGDLLIEPGAKTLRYIPTHRLSVKPVPVSIDSKDVAYTVRFGNASEWQVEPNTRLNIDVSPGLYNLVYQPADGEMIQEEVEISHHSHRFKGGALVLKAQQGAKLPILQSIYKSGKIIIDGEDSGLTVRDVERRPSLLGIHGPGTLFKLNITTKLGEVTTDEVSYTGEPLTFQLVNGLMLAKSVDSDIVFINGENVGTYHEFADSDYVVGPIEVGVDVVRLQGEGTEETPLQKILTESMGGKEIEMELTDELKKQFIDATKRFTLDNFNALKDKDFTRYTNVQAGSVLEQRLKDSFDIFVSSKDELDYVPFALRFSNDSFRVYAKDGRAYAEFIESYFIKYNETDFQNHTSWLKKMVLDESQNKWLFYEDEMLNEYAIPEDNTLVFFD